MITLENFDQLISRERYFNYLNVDIFTKIRAGKFRTHANLAMK